MIRRAGQRGSDGEDAVSEVCRLYWHPLYAFLRKRGYRQEAARDFVQSFMVRLLEKGWLRRADEHRGRFRAYIRMLLLRHVSAETARAGARKRGGGAEHVPFDADLSERTLREDPEFDDLSPEAYFKRSLAIALFDAALRELDDRYRRHGNLETLEALLPALEGPMPDETYADIGRRLGIKANAVKIAVKRMRQRFSEALRTVAARTLRLPPGPELDDEIRDLFA